MRSCRRYQSRTSRIDIQRRRLTVGFVVVVAVAPYRFVFVAIVNFFADRTQFIVDAHHRHGFDIVDLIVYRQAPRDEDRWEHHVPKPQRFSDDGIIVSDDHLQQPRLPGRQLRSRDRLHHAHGSRWDVHGGRCRIGDGPERGHGIEDRQSDQSERHDSDRFLPRRRTSSSSPGGRAIALARQSPPVRYSPRSGGAIGPTSRVRHRSWDVPRRNTRR